MNQVNFLQSLGWSLISSLWQMALLWVIYQFITISFRNKIRPRYKTSLAISLIFSGFAWFCYTFIVSLISKPDPQLFSAGLGIVSDSAWSFFSVQILPYASVIYLIILAVPAWQFIRNYKFVQVIRKTGLKKIDVAWRMYVKNTSGAMGIARDVKIWLSEWVTSPVTIGYLKPIILIPVAAINNLTPHQLEAVILHELSHIYRYDYFLNLLVSFIRTILYFNPFTRLLVKEIEREREHSCDEMVLQFQYRPGEYASALLRLEQNKYRQMVMAAAGKNHDLLHRIETILGMNKRKWQPLKQLSFALATMIGVSVLHFFISVNNKPNTQGFYTLSNELSPYYFLNSKPAQQDNFIVKSSPAKRDVKKNKIANTIEEIFNENDFPANSEIAPGFMNVNYATPEVPQLAPEEETRVKEAVDATKKILQENQWKALEKTYAEVFNSAEKTKLKSEYIDELSKANWNKLEDQLRLTYEQINWDKVNEKINLSLEQIKLDSIQQQLSFNLKTLINLEKALKENNVTAIPDTDICLGTVKENQLKTKDQLDKLKAVRSKKIVRL